MNEYIIDSYRRLPIGKYIDIIKVSRRDDLTDIDSQVEIIAILSDMTPDEVLNMPIVEYRQRAAASQFLEGRVEDVNIKIATEYRIGDFVLVPVVDHRHITTAQYIDFKEWAKGGDDNLVEIVSTMLIPKGGKYNDGYDIVAVQRAIREQLSVADVLALFAFFLRSCSALIRDFLTYLRTEAKKVTDQEKKAKILQQIAEQEALLNSVGGGSQTSTQ